MDDMSLVLDDPILLVLKDPSSQLPGSDSIAMKV